MNAILSFHDCGRSGGTGGKDTQILPAVIKRIKMFLHSQVVKNSFLFVCFFLRMAIYP